jgi:hypothetical protein
MKHAYVFLLVAVALLSSCDSGSDVTPTDSGGKNDNDSTGLAVVAVGKDTVYWGQTNWLVLNQSRSSSEGI